MAPSTNLLTETVQVGATPGAPNTGIAPTAGTSNVLRVDQLRQYVAAGGQSWLANYARSVSFAIDDITTSFGDDLYDRMMLNGTIAGTINGFRSAILEDGMELRPAVENEDEDGYDQAVAMQKAYERVFRDLPVDDLCWDLLSAMYRGNRVAEITYDDTPLGGAPKLYVAKIDVKPRNAVAFVVDVFNNVLGLLARVPGLGQSIQQGTMLTDPAQTPNLIPRSKFLVLTWRPESGDPRGTSVLRPAYTDWYELVQICVEELRYLTIFAMPSLIGTTAENADTLPLLDSDGNIIADPAGSPEAAMSANLLAFRNGSVLVKPFGTEVQVVGTGQGKSPFAAAKDDKRRQIVTAILSQTLSTMEAEHQSKSAGEVHQDLGDVIVRQGKRALARAIYGDVMRAMVRFNEGEQFEALAPVPTFGVEQHSFAEDATATAALYASGYIDPSQLPGFDKKLGAPARSEKAPPTAKPPEPAPVATQPAPNGTDDQAASDSEPASDDDQESAA